MPRRPAHAEPQTFMWDALRAIYWYRNTHIPDGQHRTAEHLVSTDKPDAVVFYLLSIESGPAG